MSRHPAGAARRAGRPPMDSAAHREAAPLDPNAPAPEPEAPARSRLEALYRTHAAWLTTALRRRFGRDQAEDLSQETFFRMRAYVEDEVRRPRALLMAIATNAAREAQRRTRVRAPDAGSSLPVSEASASGGGDQEADLLLKQLIAELPPKLRDVFVLSRFEGLTYPEIAQRCGISIKTVEWRMSRALEICAARLRD